MYYAVRYAHTTSDVRTDNLTSMQSFIIGPGSSGMWVNIAYCLDELDDHPRRRYRFTNGDDRATIAPVDDEM